MQTTAHRLTSLWTTVRTQLRDSRDAHAAQAELERELASYNTPEDLNDLHAILDRYSDYGDRGYPPHPGHPAQQLS